MASPLANCDPALSESLAILDAIEFVGPRIVV